MQPKHFSMISKLNEKYVYFPKFATNTIASFSEIQLKLKEIINVIDIMSYGLNAFGSTC